jgi:hypothetical protein
VQHGDLMPEHQDLDVLGCVRPASRASQLPAGEDQVRESTSGE